MKISIFMAIMALVALCQKDEPRLQTLAKGEHVDVILKNGFSVPGLVLRSTEKSITLDLSSDFLKLNGEITVRIEEITAVRRFGMITVEEGEKIKKEKDKALKELDSEAEKKAAEAKAKSDAEKAAETKTAETKEEKKTDEVDEDIKKGLDLLKDYPPKDGWGEEKYKFLNNRMKWLYPVYPSETEKKFMDGFQLWKKAKEYLDKKAAEESQTEPGK